MEFRTDLAVERVASARLVEKGIRQTKRGKAFRITEIEIDDDSHIRTIGKGKGRYITLEGNSLSKFSDEYEDMTMEFADELKKLVPDGEILVVGLGNNDITPDALGPQVAAKVLATRHLRDELDSQEEAFLTSLRRVSVFAGGVLGQTGIETAEIVKAICRELKPTGIIAVDALACSDISRLGTTIQLSDSGISPGSGVSNARKELSEKLFGVPVIAVGVPTVVDMHTIVRSLTGGSPRGNLPNMMVTPRDVDRLTERASQLIAYGINLALQPSLTFEDVRGLF
ncbi:MAG: GPR endopeptidase [Ruminococcus sp.]|nr:GPR endopeptidase [Ruminococcus sp.]